jgi:hypothetical protein
MSISRLKTILKYSGTFLVIWTVTLFGAEGAFRLAGDKPSADMAGLYAQFGKGYKHRPSVDTGADWSTGYFSVHTDDLGLRCDTARRMGSKAGDRVDVLFMGDSQGFGNGVNFEETIPGTVARLALEQDYLVRNSCVGGHHPPDQLMLAKALRERIQVSHYVYLFTPVALASCDSLSVANVGADGNLYGDTVSSIMLMRMWIKTHSVTFSRIRDAIRAQGIGVKPNEESSFVYELYATGELEKTRLQQCRDFLRSFKEFAAQDGGTVQLVYVPLTLETDFDRILRSAEKIGLSVDLNAPFRVLDTAAKDLNIEMHDLRPVVRELHTEGVQLSLYPDFHFTPAVSKVAGETVWQQIKANVFRDSKPKY